MTSANTAPIHNVRLHLKGGGQVDLLSYGPPRPPKRPTPVGGGNPFYAASRAWEAEWVPIESGGVEIGYLDWSAVRAVTWLITDAEAERWASRSS
jgi:hypothetical protein